MAEKKKKKTPKEEKKEKPEKKKKPRKAEKPKEKTAPKKTTEADNNVLIGRKPVMNYVVACVTFFNAGEKEVKVKARGRAISRAVDTVEVLRRSFVKDVKVKSIIVGTEQVTREEGQARNVSTMEITLTKA